MTAIGFVLCLLAFLGAWINDMIDFPEWLLGIVGVAGLSGLLCLLAGITTWLWRVMP